MLSIPLRGNYLENLTDGEIYPAYDIIGQILKNEEGGGYVQFERARMCGDCEMYAGGRRTSAGVDRTRVLREF
jgi:hypothetical protein